MDWDFKERLKRVEAETIRKLVLASNVSGDYLLGLTDESTPSKPRRRREDLA